MEVSIIHNIMYSSTCTSLKINIIGLERAILGPFLLGEEQILIQLWDGQIKDFTNQNCNCNSTNMILRNSYYRPTLWQLIAITHKRVCLLHTDNSYIYENLDSLYYYEANTNKHCMHTKYLGLYGKN